MNYIYHRVPNNLRGNILYPLNALKGIYPDTYKLEANKYTGREHVPKQRIPLWDDTLWNDVLFFIAADPNAVYEARRNAGWPDMKPQKYFKINPHELDQSKLGVFLFQTTADPTNYKIDNFTDYRYEELNLYTQIPKATKDYFVHEFEAGEPFIKLFYRYVPHILYRGEIDITNTQIITVQ